MSMKAVIVADIIKSTTFSVEQLMAIQEELKLYVDENMSWFKEHDSVFWGRVVRGDTLECYLDNPHYALRTALLLQLRMMLFCVPQNNVSIKKKTMGSLRSGIRVSVGVGDMRVSDPGKGILDGEAVYLAGRGLDGQHTAGKEKISIKRTLFYSSANSSESRAVSLMLEGIDVLLRKTTDSQREVLYYKLLGMKEVEISRVLSKSVPTINRHGIRSGWYVISDIINYYEKELYPLCCN